MDSEYLQTHLGKCLTDCLTEVSEKRPLDPIEYIAQWLYKHIENVNYKNQQADDKVILQQQEVEFEQQQERLAQMKEEKQRLKEEEAQRQKELQEQDTSGLPTLAEGEEPQETPRVEEEAGEEQQEEEMGGDEEQQEEETEQDAEEHTEDTTEKQEDSGAAEGTEQEAD